MWIEVGRSIGRGRRAALVAGSEAAVATLAGILGTDRESLALGRGLAIGIGTRRLGGRGAGCYLDREGLIAFPGSGDEDSIAIAHEWCHALWAALRDAGDLDRLDYLADQLMSWPTTPEYVAASIACVARTDPARAEQLRRGAWDVDPAIRRWGASPYANDGRELDRGRTRRYWSDPEEMAVRAFEAYVYDQVRGPVAYLVGARAAPQCSVPGVVSAYPQSFCRERSNRLWETLVGSIEWDPSGPVVSGAARRWQRYQRRDAISTRLKGLVVP